METTKLLVDHRFMIDAATNVVADISGQTETRLEPRLMKLLCMLASQPGELVSREDIIRDIWNDYGGADDALHQAVSFLRKALDDTGKTRIRTIPKKGYILDAVVDKPSSAPLTKATTFLKKTALGSNKILQLSIVTILILIASFIGRDLLFRSPSSMPSLEPGGAAPDTTYQHQELKEYLESVNAADSIRKGQ